MRYEKIDCSEELPKEDGNYITSSGQLNFYKKAGNIINIWCDDLPEEYAPDFWLKPIPDESEGAGEVDLDKVVDSLFYELNKSDKKFWQGRIEHHILEAIRLDRRNRVEVVLPIKQQYISEGADDEKYDDGFCDGWNSCILKTEELNPDVKFKEGV